MSTTVRAATPADAAALGDLLGRAFAGDPLWSWIYPQSDRSHRLARMFGTLVLVNIEAGATVLTDDRTRAAAIWQRHDRRRMNLRHNLRMGSAMIRSGAKMRRGQAALKTIEAAHPHEPHWYLAVLGTDPEHQGHGIGGELLRHVIDETGAATYLETETAANVAYYRQHGFEATGETDIRADGPHLWFMWRDADPTT